MGSRASKSEKEYDTPVLEEIVANTDVKPPETERVYVYLGPSLRGIVNNGRIFKGTKENILLEIKANAEAAGMIKKFAKISRLLVADTEVAHAKEQLAKGGNGISRAYAAILGNEEEEG